VILAGQPLFAQAPNDRQREYLNFVKAQAAQLRAADKPPAGNRHPKRTHLGTQNGPTWVQGYTG
jgi:hypothetical protein